MAHNHKLLRVLALALASAAVIGVLYGGNLVGAFQHGQSSQQGTSGERRVLYWYDAMNPQHHYDKPGKAPDGMDLVPMYADQSAPAPQSTSAGPAASGQRKILYWYDPMHPRYKSDKPGTAPDCGMTLVPKYADENATANMAAGTVTIAANKQQLIGVRTATVRREALTRSVRTTGQLTADETKIAHVHVKVTGFIDKVFVDYVGQLVAKGQPLFTLYSPDLVATQEEYLIAKRGEKALSGSQFPEVSQGSQSLLRSARERLKLWDISDDQIKRLDETGEVSHTLTFYSPIRGFVMDRKAFPQTAVNPDTELYTVSDLSTIWVNADVYEYEVPYVKVGQTALMQLSYYAGKAYTGKITYIYPTVDPVSRTVKVRIEFPNPKFELKPQMFASVDLKINYGNQIVVPQEAVLDSGNRQYVFVAHGGGAFEPRMVQIGAKLDGKAVVLSGLKPGETVVTSGNFLIDSESRLKSAMGEMSH
ncbi:MAG TPA: efflux RND transporter periplasmic adaptor subunit [Terriglobales bacterium]|nr:efflux RND transporter periplasmic adaptor subunit [Terriglobales bacterium]